jgi:signal transduction histidine kinase
MQPNLQPLIFVVDDDIFYLKLIEQNLKSAGYTRLLCFTTGEECLGNLHLMPDIILLDYNLHETNGIELLKKIKLQHQNAYIFFLSAQEEIDIAVNSIKHGAFGYIAKDESAFSNILRELKGIVAYQAVAESKNKRYSNAHFVGLGSYIAEREHEQQILIHKNEQLAKLNSELDNFVYSTSHSLRGPLSSILGMIKLAQMEQEVFDKSTFLFMMEKIASRLDYTVKDIVDYSVNNRTEIIREEINISELLEGVFENLSYLNGSARIEKQVSIEQSAPCFSDAGRLKIIFTNLLCNAIQYQDSAKANPFIRIHAEVSASKITIHLLDNGIGISPAYLGKAFNMFSRGTTKSNGAGLGLYITKEVVNKLQGAIELSSQPNEGTRFIISLPNRTCPFSSSIG